MTSASSAVTLVRRFRRLRALVIGDAMLDTYLEGTATRLCSEGPVPVVRKTSEHRAPGGAANTAANVRALGADAIYLGVVGRDAAGQALREALRAREVDDAWLVEDPQRATMSKLRVLANGQYVVRFDEGDGGPLSAACERRLIERLDDAYARCDLVLLSDYGYGALGGALLARLRELRAARPCPLLIDSKQLERFRDLGATIVTPNHHEALALAGPALPLARGGDERQRRGAGRVTHLRAPGDGRAAGDAVAGPRDGAGATGLDLAEMTRVGQRILSLLDTEHVAITLGPDGVLLLDRRGETAHVPAYPVAHPHDVGAGDSFTAALGLALAAGATMNEAARIGVDAASIAITKRWTATAQAQELLQRVSLRDADAAERLGRPATPTDLRRERARLAERLTLERQAGRTLVFTNGVFDMLSAGHMRFLRQAKALGDTLIVGVNTDRGAALLGRRRAPVMGEQDRLALVAALEPVDHVILFDEETPGELIRALRPHIHVKGGDYAGEELPEAEAVREAGGRVVILPLPGDLESLDGDEVFERVLTLAAGDGAGSDMGRQMAL